MKEIIQYATSSAMNCKMKMQPNFKLAGNFLQVGISLIVTGLAGWATPVLSQSQVDMSVKLAEVASCNTKAVFKSGQDGSYIDAINNGNSHQSVSSNLDIWQQGRSLPRGANILLTLSDTKAVADGHSVLKLSVKAYDEQGKIISKPIQFSVETSLGRLSVGPHTQQIVNMDVVTQTGEACLNLIAPSIPGESIFVLFLAMSK